MYIDIYVFIYNNFYTTVSILLFIYLYFKNGIVLLIVGGYHLQVVPARDVLV